jgi:hypothetical protein
LSHFLRRTASHFAGKCSLGRSRHRHRELSGDVAPLARRIAPPGTSDLGPALSLPELGRSKVMLYSRVADGKSRAALRVVAAAFRGPASR